MTDQEIKQITDAFSQAWGLLFNTPVYLNKYVGANDPTTVNNVYKEVKSKKREVFGPFNASVVYQPTLQLLNECGLLEPANALVTFVSTDLQAVTGSLGTVGYLKPSTQDTVIIVGVDGIQRTMRLSEFTPQVQFGPVHVFLNIGVVDVLT